MWFPGRRSSVTGRGKVEVANNGNNLEVEVKFLVPDLANFRETLLAAGARLERPRVYERNVRYDTVDDRLLQRDELLRLRQDTVARLTFKGVDQSTGQSEAKVREEIEVEVEDFDRVASIIKRLGYEPKQVYEKYRETFWLGEVEVVLDEMPFGNFVELEGEEDVIKAAADRLGLDWNRRIVTNYLDLMARLKAYHNLSFDDLTFANFEGLPVSVADILLYG